MYRDPLAGPLARNAVADPDITKLIAMVLHFKVSFKHRRYLLCFANCLCTSIHVGD